MLNDAVQIEKNTIFVLLFSKIMEKEKVILELSAFPFWKAIDTETCDCYLTLGEAPILSASRKTFADATEILVNGFYFGMTTFTEDGKSFRILTAYRLNPLKYPKRYFAFGAYDKSTNELFMFFNGVSTTNDRTMAINVYNELVKYCKENFKTLNPFAIKL